LEDRNLLADNNSW